MNYFIIVFERDLQKEYAEFHRDFVRHPKIRAWWHYLKSAYLVVTELESTDLSQHANEIFDRYGLRKTHLILEVNLADRAGMLPKDAWEWLTRRAKEQWKEFDPGED